MQTVLRKAEQDMKRATEATLKDFNSVRTGRADASSRFSPGTPRWSRLSRRPS